ncbi:bifunctional monothiol glutaredoxin-S16, chloroplastic-like [Salvia miltiorrhiza]|uniref:bifunctional monothiol glutaredoxin-S16, chloroplastic-like n=1 Tax=Salvia miltiorrhiza TaxID=226208 RepID=UPI0025AC0E07|nr:bifunctional monothiol glutaredoxin-S16, chloroplastic-like [Salvia miltiorrhiza]
MAALNLSSPTHSPYSLRLLSNFSNSRNAPALSFNSLPNPAAFFHSASFKHRSPAKRRRPGLVVSALQKLSETESVTVSSDSDGNFPSESGVYAIYDSGGDLQF